MALIVEDGTAKANAESFASVAFCDTYHAARGNTSWALLEDTDKEQALRKATDYMQQTYRRLWAGLRRTSTQALDWPRSEAPRPDVGDYYPIDEVPREVQAACAELAYRSSAGTVLLADQSREVLEQTVGPITTKYAQGSPQAKRFTAVDAILSACLVSSAGSAMMRLVRA